MPPTFLISEHPTPYSRSIHLIRSSTQAGLLGQFWHETLAEADSWQNQPPITPTTVTPGRDPNQARVANRDYVVVMAAQTRIITGALAYLITEKPAYLKDAVLQAKTLMDETLWPDWRDLAHLNHPVDLRTGQLLFALGLLINWAGDKISPPDRQLIIQGTIERGLKPSLLSLEQKTNFLNPDTDKANNWLAVVVAGYGIAAMSLSQLDPQWDALAHDAADRMTRFMNCYGPKGESNESMGYSPATRLPVMFFAIHRCWTAGKDNRLAQWPFVENCRWQMQFLLPGAIPAPFGDTHPARPLNVSQYAAIADAAGDGLIQWAYLHHRPAAVGQNPAAWFELLTYNPTLHPTTPQEANLPLAAAYRAHAAYIVSRSEWSHVNVPIAVFSKAGFGNEIHGHHDAGAVCIYLDNHPVIIDPGIPTPVYPKDFWGPNRYKFYQSSSIGHNVPQIDGRETSRREEDRAKLVDFNLKNHAGIGACAAWSIDLTPLYPAAHVVHRAVIQAGPFVAVLDRIAASPQAALIASRWHTAKPVSINGDGSFTIPTPSGANLACLLAAQHATPLFLQGTHKNTPPFDRTRIDTPLDQRHEAWVESALRDSKGIFLSFFARQEPNDPAPVFSTSNGAHRVATLRTVVDFSFDGLVFKASDTEGNIIIETQLAGPVSLRPID
jgi:hypothetical protein